MTKLNEAQMPVEFMNLIQKLASAALKESFRAHGKADAGGQVSSISKRLAGKLRGAFYMVPKGDGVPADEVGLRARILQLESNFAKLDREYQKVAKKKRQQDRRLRVAFEALDGSDDEWAANLAQSIRAVKE